jgi:hypothetical protein
MRRKLSGLLMIGLYALIFAASAPAQMHTDAVSNWDFDVYLTLWYSPDDEWLALESVAKGGHILRYGLS